MELSLHPEWLEPFKGSGHSFLDCELLSLEKIEPVLRELDWEATDTIWFDYARLHPVKAFYYFCQCYGNAYGRYLEANISYEMRFQRGIKGDPLESRELKSLLSIKRAADKQGIPYEVWLQTLFNQFAGIGWTRPPRPSHLATSDEGQQKAIERWASMNDEFTAYPKDPWFMTDSYCGHPQQIRAEDWIVNSIQHRNNKDLSLSVALYDKEVIRIERAIEVFGQDLVESAQNWHLNIAKLSQH